MMYEFAIRQIVVSFTRAHVNANGVCGLVWTDGWVDHAVEMACLYGSAVAPISADLEVPSFSNISSCCSAPYLRNR